MIIIEQINNGFASCYYLLDDGRVYNKETDCFLALNKHSYRLKTVNGKYKSISLKDLYLLVFNRCFCKDSIESLEGEEWRELPDSKGKYWISNKARIKSYSAYEAYLLNPFLTSRGYKRVSTFLDGERQDYLVHRLVALCFLPNPARPDYQIHHKDFNPANNDLSNLVYLSPSEHRKLHSERNKELNERTKSEENTN